MWVDFGHGAVISLQVRSRRIRETLNHEIPTAGNPFSTRHVRPGAIEYLFPPGHGIEQLVRRLAQSDWTGQIVGPHGSGKSTLLASLRAALRDAGRRTHLVVLHDGRRRMPPED